MRLNSVPSLQEKSSEYVIVGGALMEDCARDGDRRVLFVVTIRTKSHATNYFDFSTAACAAAAGALSTIASYSKGSFRRPASDSPCCHLEYPLRSTEVEVHILSRRKPLVTLTATSTGTFGKSSASSSRNDSASYLRTQFMPFSQAMQNRLCASRTSGVIVSVSR